MDLEPGTMDSVRARPFGQLFRPDNFVFGAFLASFDYSLAFDLTDPAVVERLFGHLGLPASVNRLIAGVWQHQKRWVEVQGHVHNAPCEVTSSMPQGDCWNVIGMNALLAGPVVDLKARFPQARQGTWMDDRSWTTPTASMAAALGAAWRRWSATLGLKDNGSKEQFSHRTAEGRRALGQQAGAAATAVKVAPLILGCYMQPARRVGLQDKEQKRLDVTAVRLRRIAMLPLHTGARRPFVSGVLGGATWGWVARRPPAAAVDKLEATVRRALRMPKRASPHLFEMLMGHFTSVFYRAVEAQVTTAVRRVGKTRALPGARGGVGWPKCLWEWMQQLGWQENVGVAGGGAGALQEGWRWWRPVTQATIRLRPAEVAPVDKVMHDLRESWRATKYSLWQRQARNDSFVCRRIGYDSRRLKAAIGAYRRDPAVLLVLTGATMSPAAWASAHGEDIQCPVCGERGGGPLPASAVAVPGPGQQEAAAPAQRCAASALGLASAAERSNWRQRGPPGVAQAGPAGHLRAPLGRWRQGEGTGKRQNRRRRRGCRPGKEEVEEEEDAEGGWGGGDLVHHVLSASFLINRILEEATRASSSPFLARG
ncbi:unnamed protein product [Prorocentrum cordatum]|uniref:Reverse transcriptase domain-containing protein n=1 Tax=Prorocentrum cordatum TaxID=2364126 RepID=A0ABN9QK46_9DINO|nr:unnamed protein product [Polarella glacialis]